jgi:hypothetical protein
MSLLRTSVVDPWHFGTDPGPDPAFSSVADNMPTKIKFFFQSLFCLLLFEGTFT